MLILAGISIAQLTGNGLFEKAKLAKEVSKNAQDDENDKIAKYSNEIDMFSTRNTLSSQVVLYENTNLAFTTGNITLKQDIDKYNRFTVYCYLGDRNRSKYYEVYEKGKNVLLDGEYMLDSTHFRDACIELILPMTGKTATLTNAYLEQNGGAFYQCHVAVYKIVGYVD